VTIKNIFWIISLALGLVACGDGNVKSEVKAFLMDLSSAEFKSITAFKNGNYCGEVNSKNRMGGYVGYKAFSKVDGKLEIDEIIGLEHLCEIAKDSITHKCADLKKILKIIEEELQKANPFKERLTREQIEIKKFKDDAEYTTLLCANQLLKTR